MTRHDSDTLKGISSMATRQVLADLCLEYSRHSGRAVDLVAVGGVDAAQRVRAGEALDFVVLAADAIEQLAASGHVVAASRIDLARSGIAIAVRAGTPRPDIGSEAAVREAVLRAGSIGYSTGPSGVYLMRLFERWGIAAQIAPRTVQAKPGVPVGALIARGDVELGFQQLSELLHVPGIEVVGALPRDIQLSTVFCAAICATSSRPDATAALLSFLASRDADDAKRRQGMEPV